MDQDEMCQGGELQHTLVVFTAKMYVKMLICLFEVMQ